jgi:hypothetical protein
VTLVTSLERSDRSGGIGGSVESVESVGSVGTARGATSGKEAVVSEEVITGAVGATSGQRPRR